MFVIHKLLGYPQVTVKATQHFSNLSLLPSHLVRRIFTCDNTGILERKLFTVLTGTPPVLSSCIFCNDVFNLKEIKERKCYCISQSSCKWYPYNSQNVGTWMPTRDTRKGLCCVNKHNSRICYGSCAGDAEARGVIYKEQHDL